jgi:hypothetical protein
LCRIVLTLFNSAPTAYFADMGKANTGIIRLYRRHWSEELAVVFLLVVTAGTVLGFVRYGNLDKNPWGYIATAVAIFSALTGMILTIAEAMRETNVDD